MFINNFLITTCDSAERWQTGIQDTATLMLEGMLSFYNELMFYIVFIGIAVICTLYVILTNFREENSKKVVVVKPYFSLWEIFSSIPTRPKHPLIIYISASKNCWVCEYSYEPRRGPSIKKKVFLDRKILVLPHSTSIKIVFSSVDDIGHSLVVPGINLRLHAPAGGSTETTINLLKSIRRYDHPVYMYIGDCPSKPTTILITRWDKFLIWFVSPITNFIG
jgi:heme/copper-type cytochrome/quinol oxidase subunit 2